MCLENVVKEGEFLWDLWHVCYHQPFILYQLLETQENQFQSSLHKIPFFSSKEWWRNPWMLFALSLQVPESVFLKVILGLIGSKESFELGKTGSHTLRNKPNWKKIWRGLSQWIYDFLTLCHKVWKVSHQTCWINLFKFLVFLFSWIWLVYVLS